MRLHYLKLDVNILDDNKIKLIRKHIDGSSLFVLWIGLLCMGMKSKRLGKIEIDEGVGYNIDELVKVLDIPLDTIKLGLTLFERYKMVELDKNNVISLNNFEKHQAIEKISYERSKTAKRVQNYRLKHQKISKELALIDKTDPPLHDRYMSVTESVVTPHDHDHDHDHDKEKEEEEDSTEKLYDLNKRDHFKNWLASKGIKKPNKEDYVKLSQDFLKEIFSKKEV